MICCFHPAHCRNANPPVERSRLSYLAENLIPSLQANPPRRPAPPRIPAAPAPPRFPVAPAAYRIRRQALSLPPSAPPRARFFLPRALGAFGPCAIPPTAPVRSKCREGADPAERYWACSPFFGGLILPSIRVSWKSESHWRTKRLLPWKMPAFMKNRRKKEGNSPPSWKLPTVSLED